MIWLLLACTRAPDDTQPTDDSPVDSPAPDDTDDTHDTGAARPVLSNPAAPTDLDDASDVLHVALTAAPHTYEVAGETVQGFAYNGQVPGPTLRMNTGDTLVVEVTNALDVPTTIHWHGVDSPFAMDGVPWMTDPIDVGETFTYTQTIDQTGTFFFHPHFDSARTVDLGLYGMLVVQDPTEPVADHDLELVFDSWGEHNPDGHTHGFDTVGDPWTVNGLSDPVVPVAAGETVRARVLNASNMGYLALRDVRVIGGDQGLLAEPQQVELLVLGPGDRAELEFLPGDADVDVVTAPWTRAGGLATGDDQRLFTLQVDAPGAPAEPLAYGFSGALPTVDPGHTDVRYVFQGSETTGVWLINGETFPDVTIERLDLGSVGILEVRNVSPSEHPFHLHGMAFEVLSIDGVAPSVQRIEDTLNVGVRQVVRLRVQADNPGDWMAHCHILPHAEGGMMTVLRVD